MDFNSSFLCVKVVGFDDGLVNSAKVPFFPGIFSRPVVRVFIVFIVFIVSIHSSSSSASSSSTKAESCVWPYPTTAILYRQLVGWSLTTFHRRRLFASYFFVFFIIIIIFFVVLLYVASLCFYYAQKEDGIIKVIIIIIIIIQLRFKVVPPLSLFLSSKSSSSPLKKEIKRFGPTPTTKRLECDTKVASRSTTETTKGTKDRRRAKA